MPSRLHEDLLRLFQNRPTLAAEVARSALHAELPEFAEARIDSASLNDLRPAEYRADCVVVLLQDQPVLGIIVEVQLGRDEEKAFAWPPGGHFKFPHPWPGQIPPVDSGRTM